MVVTSSNGVVAARGTFLACLFAWRHVAYISTILYVILRFKNVPFSRSQKAEREHAVIGQLVQFFGEQVNQYIEYQDKVRNGLTLMVGPFDLHPTATSVFYGSFNRSL